MTWWQMLGEIVAIYLIGFFAVVLGFFAVVTTAIRKLPKSK